MSENTTNTVSKKKTLTASERDAIKGQLYIREHLDSPVRHYKYSEEIEESWKKELHYLDHDVKMLSFARNELDAISDCYLIYAVSCLGVTEAEGIKLFLTAIKNSTAGVTIMDVDNSDYLRGRLKALTRLGMFFRFKYKVTVEHKGEMKDNLITLYTTLKDSQAFMNQKLGKNLVFNDWIQAKPHFELMGWAAAAYTASVIAQSDRFIEFDQGVFSTKAIGTRFIPSIVKLRLNESEPVYVGVMGAFLHRLKGGQSENDYKRNCSKAVAIIKQFLYSKDSGDKYARMVVVVEDNADLNEMADCIQASENLFDDYDRVYFTGEGALKTIPDVKKCFLVMKRENTEKGYSFVPKEPDFM